MSLFSRFLRARPPELYALWCRVAQLARDPRWYTAHAVPDTVDGRFDMVALVTSLVILRLEREGLEREVAQLTERFVEDMDSSLRTIGIGDLKISKHMGRVIGGLGGRLGSYREALATGENGLLCAALGRNVFRGTLEGGDERLVALAEEVRHLEERIREVPRAALLAGEIA